MLRQAHDGAIVVLHITQANAPRTPDALPAISTASEPAATDIATKLGPALGWRPTG